MLVYAIIGLVAFGLVVLVGSLIVKAARADEVEKFHRARELTTEWARHYATTTHHPMDVDSDVA